MPFHARDINALGPEIFRLAVEACPSGMIVVDSGGVIVMINNEVERLFGYRREELLGRSVDILLPENVRGKHVKQRAGFMQHPNARHLGMRRDFIGRCKDSGEIPIEVGLNPMSSCQRRVDTLRDRRYPGTQTAGAVTG